MTRRQRVINMLQGRPVDRPVVQYFYPPVGFYEHGERLNDLFEKYPGDFCPFVRQPIPDLPASAFDSEGKYYERITDEWSVTQEYRVYGIMGHAINFPIKSNDDAKNYIFPAQPPCVQNPDLYKAEINREKENYFTLRGCEGLLQRMWSLRGFENTMMDLVEDTPEINNLMDRLADYLRSQIEAAVNAGVDAVSVGDDYGTQEGLILSKDTFRKVVKPRLAHILEPARKAGLHIHFHSCGLVIDLFDDFKDLGIASLWPQLPLYDMHELKRALDDYGFSIAIHTDRAVTMTFGTTEDVRNAVLLEKEIFKPMDGNAWFYIEVDTGFPYENIKTLVETVFKL